MTLIIVEPTYRDAEHAPVNAVFAQALATSAACIAATPTQHDALTAIDPSAALPSYTPIAVLPPGGVTLHRMRTQWRTLAALVTQHRATKLLLLSAGPETLFVARALVTRYPALTIHAIMHGNMADLAGWRSRDPRRRLIDLRAGLRWANHPRIHLVVLEQYIADAAHRGSGPAGRGRGWRGIHNPLRVWPHPTMAQEQPTPHSWSPGPRLRLTVPGTANREKGFDTILALAADAPQHDWFVTGRLGAEYRDAPIAAAPGRLSRPDYLAALRSADYAVLAHQPAYDLTASGSILDCATNGIPIIALHSPAMDALTAAHGALGYGVPDRAAADALLHSPALQDHAAYARFQTALDALHRSRTAAALAPLLHRDLGTDA